MKFDSGLIQTGDPALLCDTAALRSDLDTSLWHGSELVTADPGQPAGMSVYMPHLPDAQVLLAAPCLLSVLWDPHSPLELPLNACFC